MLHPPGGDLYGVQGIALATVLSFWVIAFVSVPLFLRGGRFQLLEPKPGKILLMIKLGIPAALCHVCDTGFFAAVTFLVTQYGVEALAAHHLALQFLFLPFMIPYACSVDLSVRVAYHYGRGDLPATREVVVLGLVWGLFPIL